MGEQAGRGWVTSLSADGRFVGTSRRSRDDTESGNAIRDVDGDYEIAVKGLGVSISGDATAGVSSEECPPDGCTNGIWYQSYKVPGRHGSLARCNSPDYGYIGQHGRRTGIRVKLCKNDLNEGSEALRGIKPPGWPIANPDPNLNVPSGWPVKNYRVNNSDGGPVWVFQRGHLLGNQLGGSGAMRSNLIIQFGNSNNLLQKPIEVRVKKALEGGDGEQIYYYVTPVYADKEVDVQLPLPPEIIGPNGYQGFLPSLEYPMPNKIHIIARGSEGFFLDACIVNTNNEVAVVAYNDPCIT